MISERSAWGNMLQTYYVDKIRELNRVRDQRLSELNSRESALAYIEEVRKKIASCFTVPSADEVPPAEVTGTVACEGFTIEKIIYYSRPGFPVTASLYLPQICSDPVPGVLFLCGHSANGKACDAYQAACQGLALQGYAVLSIDPVSQGERWQYTDLTAHSGANGLTGVNTHAHNMMGKQMLLCGDYFGSWRAWDAISGLNYLLSRPEIDTARVGITGNSGGGTMTTFVQALDPRFTMAAPSCYVTSWQRNFENEVPADVEQIPPGILAAGCEMGDFILAYAPRPVLLLGQKNDFFDRRGLQETYEKIRRVYALLGAEENIKYFVGPTNHGLSVENRCAIYDFFNDHAAVSGASGEPAAVSPLPDAQLNCTPTGQTADLPGTKKVRDFIVEKAAALAAARPEPNGAALREIFRKKLAIPQDIQEPYFRVLRQTMIDTFSPLQRIYSRFALESEPGIVTHLKLLDADGLCHLPDAETVTLYVSDLDASEEMTSLAAEKGLLYGLDVRGTGESMPLNCRVERNESFLNQYGADYHFSSCALMFDDSILSGRVRDVLAAVKLLRSRKAENIHLVGNRLGAIPAVLAALLEHENITSVSLYHAPESWTAMASAPVTMWPQSVMLPGILKYADLPDVYRVLKAEGKLAYIDFADQMMRRHI